MLLDPIGGLSIDGNWGQWSSWSRCSKKCDGGSRERVRQCDSPSRKGKGQPCDGEGEEVELCNEEECQSGMEQNKTTLL